MNLIKTLQYYGFFKNNLYFYPEYLKELFFRLWNKKRLLAAEFFFESGCNLNCWHCSSEYYRGKRTSMNIARIKIALQKLKSIGVLSVCYVGGEPTIRSDLLKIISLTRNFRILPSIITNATLIDETYIDNLYKSGIANIGFSIQSPDEKEHDKLVGKPGAFSKLQNLIKYCVRKKYVISICAVPTNENLINGEFDKLMKFAEKYNIRVNVNLPAPVGKLYDNEDFLLSDISLKKIFSDYIDRPYFLPDFKIIGKKLKAQCPMGKNSIYILPDGEVCPCTFTHISFGNILKENIKNIMKNLYQSNLIKSFSKETACPIAMDRKFIRKVNAALKNSKEYPAKWNNIIW